MNNHLKCRVRLFCGLSILAGCLGLTGCNANIEYIRASGSRHICPGDRVEVSYLVVNVDDFVLARKGAMWRSFSALGGGRRADALQDTLTDNPEVDTTYAATIRGPGLAWPMTKSEGRDVIVGTEVKPVRLRLTGCRGLGAPQYVPEKGARRPAGHANRPVDRIPCAGV
jgi:hypothetical protein